MNTALQGFKKFKLVIISTIIGLVINTILDIPLILLLNKLNLTPYYGTMIATIIGATISALIILIYLKKEINFSYKKIRRNIKKILIPLLSMTIVALAFNYFTPYIENRIILIIKCAFIGTIGGLIYFIGLDKNNGLNQIFGKDQIIRIKKKLKLIK